MTSQRMKTSLLWIGTVFLLLGANHALGQSRRHEPIIPNLPTNPSLAPSTVPPNGDLNPYGVAFVPHNFAGSKSLKSGDIVVSNFNDSANVQGTGTTIVRITPDAQTFVFFQGPAGLGFTTALGVLRRGFVLVGSLPTTDGTCSTIGQTSLLIIDRNGSLVATLSDPSLLNGPWDLTIHDQGELAQVFVSNVLSGTVTRINLKIGQHGNPIVEGMTQIASGYGIACNAAAVVVGPTGLAYDAVKDILYVASTSDNEIFAVPNARKTKSDQGTGTLVYQDNVHLHGPLGLLLAPNGDLITANGDAINGDPSQPSELVEFTPAGQFIGQFSVDPSQGAAFGLAVKTSGDRVTFAAVDDATNILDIWDLD
jgi:hypothetical protein